MAMECRNSPSYSNLTLDRHFLSTGEEKEVLKGEKGTSIPSRMVRSKRKGRSMARWHRTWMGWETGTVGWRSNDAHPIREYINQGRRKPVVNLLQGLQESWNGHLINRSYRCCSLHQPQGSRRGSTGVGVVVRLPCLRKWQHSDCLPRRTARHTLLNLKFWRLRPPRSSFPKQ